VVDGNNNRIQLFTKEGTFIKKFGSECFVKTGLKPSDGCKDEDGDGGPLEMGDGQFKYPAGVTVLSDTIFVADNFNDRVQAFNIELGPLPSVGPTADAGEDQTLNSGEKVTLDGELSKPDDGTLKFLWRQTAGSQSVDLINPDSAKPEFDTSQITQDTTLKFELKVADSNNQVDTDTVNVNVIGRQDNQKPQANAGGDKTVYEGQSVELDGTESQDSDGTIESYEWEAGNCDNNEPKGIIQNSNDEIATFVAPQISSTSTSCEVQLRVTDNDGETDSETIQVTVREKPSFNTQPFTAGPGLKAQQ